MWISGQKVGKLGAKTYILHFVTQGQDGKNRTNFC